MKTREIKKLINESKKISSPEIERIRKILEQLESHKRYEVVYEIEYWSAEW